MLTAREVIQERAKAAARLAEKFHAEAQGLLCASYRDLPIAYAQDADLQQAFLRGFCEGRAIVQSFPAAPSDVDASAPPDAPPTATAPEASYG